MSSKSCSSTAAVGAAFTRAASSAPRSSTRPIFRATTNFPSLRLSSLASDFFAPASFKRATSSSTSYLPMSSSFRLKSRMSAGVVTSSL